jgi:hypothetical protein
MYALLIFKDTDISRLANTFKIQAELALKELQTLIQNATDNKLDDEEIIQIIVTCATFIGEESWTNSDLNKSAIGKVAFSKKKFFFFLYIKCRNTFFKQQSTR